jgi:hypothetical protein
MRAVCKVSAMASPGIFRSYGDDRHDVGPEGGLGMASSSRPLNPGMKQLTKMQDVRRPVSEAVC